MDRLSIKVLVVMALLVVGSAGPVVAQDPSLPEGLDSLALGEWELGMTGRLSGSQAAYHNWVGGGVNTLAITATITGEANHLSPRWLQHYELRLGYGLIKQDTLDIRKAEDLIRLLGTLQYRGDDFFRIFRPTIALEARTQFTAGYNYDAVPEALGDRTLPVKVSDFLSPGVFMESIGLTYAPTSWFSQRIGFASKQTVVLIDRLRPLYGLDPLSAVRVEGGLESVTKVDRVLFENVQLQSTLSLFAAFKQLRHPDVLWRNLIIMQVNKWLGVNFEFTTVYDQDVSSAVQLKEVLSVGVTVILI